MNSTTGAGRSVLVTNADFFSSLPIGLDVLCGVLGPGELGPEGSNCP